MDRAPSDSSGSGAAASAGKARAGVAERRSAKGLHKGQQTKAHIVDAALRLATQIGLEGLSIGLLADVTGMSKSGVFAHFGSREEMQISVIREYHQRFENEVFLPALNESRGLPRLRALFANWMQRTSIEIDSGCLYISGAVEFDDREGPVRDALKTSVHTWLDAMRRVLRQARELGQLTGDVTEDQVLFEIHGLILALHYEARFLKSPGSMDRALRGFDNLLARYASAPSETGARAMASARAKPRTRASRPSPATEKKATVPRRAPR